MATRRDVFLLPALLTPAFAASGLSESTVRASAAKVTKADFGETSVYFDGPTGQLQSLYAGSVLLHPGQQPHPPHQNPEEEIVVIAEGNGSIFLDGKWSPAPLGTMMYCGANKLHGIRNTGKTPLLFYFSKWKAGA